CLTIAWRFGLRAIGAALVAATVISLALAQVAVVRMPAATFYLLPTRGWELAIGACVALLLWRRPAPARSIVTEGASAIGLALILSAVFLFSRSTPFPGVYALLPTVGAALILLSAAPDTLV